MGVCSRELVRGHCLSGGALESIVLTLCRGFSHLSWRQWWILAGFRQEPAAPLVGGGRRRHWSATDFVTRPLFLGLRAGLDPMVMGYCAVLEFYPQGTQLRRLGEVSSRVQQ